MKKNKKYWKKRAKSLKKDNAKLSEELSVLRMYNIGNKDDQLNYYKDKTSKYAKKILSDKIDEDYSDGWNNLTSTWDKSDNKLSTGEWADKFIKDYNIPVEDNITSSAPYRIRFWLNKK